MFYESQALFYVGTVNPTDYSFSEWCFWCRKKENIKNIMNVISLWSNMNLWPQTYARPTRALFYLSVRYIFQLYELLSYDLQVFFITLQFTKAFYAMDWGGFISSMQNPHERYRSFSELPVGFRNFRTTNHPSCWTLNQELIDAKRVILFILHLK